MNIYYNPSRKKEKIDPNCTNENCCNEGNVKTNNQNRIGNILKFNSDDIIQGIIYSEILNKPKALFRR